MVQKIEKIKKRDGVVVEFSQEKITNAIEKAFAAVGQQDMQLVGKISDKVYDLLKRRFKKET